MKKKQLKAELKDAQKALEISNKTIKMQVGKSAEDILKLKDIEIEKLKDKQEATHKSWEFLHDTMQDKLNKIKQLKQQLSDAYKKIDYFVKRNGIVETENIGLKIIKEYLECKDN